MSDKQLHQAEQHIINATVIVEHMTELFKNKDEQDACIVIETLDVLPKLASNLSDSYSIITQ